MGARSRDWSPTRVSSSWSRPRCPPLSREQHRAGGPDPPRDPPAQGSPGLLATPNHSGSGGHSSSFLAPLGGPPSEPPCPLPPAERQALRPGVIAEELLAPPRGPQAPLGTVGGEPGLGVTVKYVSGTPGQPRSWHLPRGPSLSRLLRVTTWCVASCPGPNQAQAGQSAVSAECPETGGSPGSTSM